MKKNLSILGFLIILLILLLLLFLINPTQTAIFLNSLDQKVIKNSSFAEISTEGNTLTLKFALTEQETSDAEEFSHNLGTDSNWLEGISLTLDSNSAAYIKEFAQAKVSVDFASKSLHFKNQSLPKLQTALIKNEYSYATKSGRLKLKTKGDSEFKLEIIDPGVIFREATPSGKLNLSEKLIPIFPILSKMDTIRLEVDGKNVSGQIMLK